MSAGAVETKWYKYSRSWSSVAAEVIEESQLAIHINAVEWVELMCTPSEQEHLALGFLKNEGVIDKLDDVRTMYLTESGCCIDIFLNYSVEKPERVILTSGCGGGVTFDNVPIDEDALRSDDLRIEPAAILELYRHLHAPDSLHHRSRGVHTSALTDGERLLVVSEDIGRHNTIDKVAGACLMQGIDTRGRMLMSTGRISSEMLRKAASLGCPIVASLNSPTSKSVAMAQSWGMTLIGYSRGRSMRVYTHPERLGYVHASTEDVLIINRN